MLILIEFRCYLCETTKFTVQSQLQLHLQSWIKYFEQTSILKKSLFSSLHLSNNVENVDNIHAGLAQLQHC